MSVGTLFLHSLITDDESRAEDRVAMSVRSGIAEDSFQDEGNALVWRFVSNYFDRYHRLPSIDIVELECEFSFPEYAPDEPFEYWLDQLMLFNQHCFIQEGIDRIYRELNNGRTLRAADFVKSMHDGLMRFDPRSNISRIDERAGEAIRRHDEIQQGLRLSGVPVGFEYIDRVTGGAQEGDKWSYVGRPGVGKTFLALQAVRGAASMGEKVLLVSMEMSGMQMARRHLSMGAGIDAKLFRLGRLSYFARNMVSRYYDETVLGQGDLIQIVEGRLNLNVRDIVVSIRTFKPKLVVVDGAYMVSPMEKRGNSTWERVLNVANELKKVAQDEAVPVIGTYQFNRDGARSQKLENIAGSDAIGQVSSVVLSIADEAFSCDSYVPIVYKIVELLKGREGEKGKIRIRCDMRRSSVEQESVLVSDSALDVNNDPEPPPGDDDPL